MAEGLPTASKFHIVLFARYDCVPGNLGGLQYAHTNGHTHRDVRVSFVPQADGPRADIAAARSPHLKVGEHVVGQSPQSLHECGRQRHGILHRATCEGAHRDSSSSGGGRAQRVGRVERTNALAAT